MSHFSSLSSYMVAFKVLDTSFYLMIEVIIHFIIIFYQHLHIRFMSGKNYNFNSCFQFFLFNLIMHEVVQVVYLGKRDVCQFLECDS